VPVRAPCRQVCRVLTTRHSRGEPPRVHDRSAAGEVALRLTRSYFVTQQFMMSWNS
jgi:hypothetical protein